MSLSVVTLIPRFPWTCSEQFYSPVSTTTSWLCSESTIRSVVLGLFVHWFHTHTSLSNLRQPSVGRTFHHSNNFRIFLTRLLGRNTNVKGTSWATESIFMLCNVIFLFWLQFFEKAAENVKENVGDDVQTDQLIKEACRNVLEHVRSLLIVMWPSGHLGWSSQLQRTVWTWFQVWCKNWVSADSGIEGLVGVVDQCVYMHSLDEPCLKMDFGVSLQFSPCPGLTE